MKNLSVWIQGTCSAGDIRAMLTAYKGIKFTPARSIQASDMVLYTGGFDVNPVLYGEVKLECTSVYIIQDKLDMDCFREAARTDKLQVGICRGSQFLNVMNGGSLWQDVDGHGRNHEILDHTTGKKFLASSTHHQMSRLNSKGEMLASANISTRKVSSKNTWTRGENPSCDVEAFWYPETRSLGVQWHPEYGPESCREVFFQYLEKYGVIQESKAA